MRRNVLVISIMLTLTLFSSIVFAQTTPTRVTVGGTYWNAAYSWTDKDGNKVGDIGSGNTLGPYLRVTHGKLNLGISMFIGGFDVENLEFIDTIYGDFNDWYLYSNFKNLNRSDLNFTIGYQIIPYINLFAGLKYLRYAYDGDFNLYESYYLTEQDNGTFELSRSGAFFGIGVAGVLPFGQSPLYGYASLAGMAGTLTNKLEYDGRFDVLSGSTEEKSDVSSSLAAFTIGIGYNAPSGLGVSLGYRADLFDENAENNTSSDEENYNVYVQGINLTVSYTF